MNNRAATAMQDRHFADALPLLGHALAIREKTVGPESTEVAKVLTNLGFVKQELKDYEGAIAIRTKTPGPDHPDTVNPIENLGLVLQSMGDTAGARVRLEQAFAVRMKTLGPAHPETIRLRSEIDKLGR